MSSIFKRKTECTLIGTKEDGTKTYVCRVDDSKVFQVEMDKEGNIHLDAKFVIATPEDYRKIHDALQKAQASSPI